MKTYTYYVAVQVVSRFPDGSLKDYYEQTPRASESEARADTVAHAKEFPGTPYTTVRKQMTEIGIERKRPALASAPASKSDRIAAFLAGESIPGKS